MDTNTDPMYVWGGRGEREERERGREGERERQKMLLCKYHKNHEKATDYMNWANSKELLFPLPSLPPTYIDVSALVSLPQVLHEGFLREWVQHHHVPAPYHLVQEVGVLLPTRTHHPLQRPRGHLCEINLLLDEWMCSKETNIIGRDFNLGLVVTSQMLIQTGVLALGCSKTHSVSRLGVTDTSQHVSEHLPCWDLGCNLTLAIH